MGANNHFVISFKAYSMETQGRSAQEPKIGEHTDFRGESMTQILLNRHGIKVSFDSYLFTHILVQPSDLIKGGSSCSG